MPSIHKCKSQKAFQSYEMDRFFYKAVVALNNSGVNILKQGHLCLEAIDTFRDAINIINSNFYKAEDSDQLSLADVQESIHRASLRCAKASLPGTKKMTIDENVDKVYGGRDQVYCNIVIADQQQTNPLPFYNQLLATTNKSEKHSKSPKSCTLIHMDDTIEDEWFDILDVVSSTLLYNYAQVHWYFFITHRQCPNKKVDSAISLKSSFRIFQMAESVASKFFNNEELYETEPLNGMFLVSLLISHGLMQASYFLNLPSLYQDQQVVLQELVRFIEQHESIYPYTESTTASAA